MILVYAESSAVLAWLLGEPAQGAIIKVLSGADVVTTSALTLVECTRGLRRARSARRISAADELATIRLLDDAVGGWNIVELSDEVVQRARQRFPYEPVRSLDALHLASALVLHEQLGALQLLTLDDRVRQNAEAVGLVVVP